MNFGSAANDANKVTQARRRKLLAESTTRSHYIACGALRDAEAAEAALSAAAGSQHVDHLYKSATTDTFCYLVYATMAEVSSLARENVGILRYILL
jgi:CO/xanthine dehydrogenase Mo-binding subunit